MKTMDFYLYKGGKALDTTKISNMVEYTKYFESLLQPILLLVV